MRNRPEPDLLSSLDTLGSRAPRLPAWLDDPDVLDAVLDEAIESIVLAAQPPRPRRAAGASVDEALLEALVDDVMAELVEHAPGVPNAHRGRITPGADAGGWSAPTAQGPSVVRDGHRAHPTLAFGI